ncbi:MAG TPA: 2-phospho-L-lactate guanylyltransferase [Candidatus Limnocylindrales bacterium]|nr:2-phospho-L-lactate guanylyltransferase [Candidatus Limnocylindrales bacterium]
MTRSETADLSVLHVIVPLRGAASGKSRLGLALDAEERQVLILGMLASTLDALASWPSAAAVHLVTDERQTMDLVRGARPGINLVAEPPDGGLNTALRAARDAAIARGATAILILPADLPLITAAALEAMLDSADAAVAAGGGRPVVAIAAADARRGTNALLLSPPDIVEPEFGDASLEAHLRAAAEAEASVQLVIDPALGFDLDTPDDLERLELGRMLELERLGQLMLQPGLEVESEPEPAAGAV